MGSAVLILNKSDLMVFSYTLSEQKLTGLMIKIKKKQSILTELVLKQKVLLTSEQD